MFWLRLKVHFLFLLGEMDLKLKREGKFEWPDMRLTQPQVFS